MVFSASPRTFPGMGAGPSEAGASWAGISGLARICGRLVKAFGATVGRECVLREEGLAVPGVVA